MVTDPVNNVLLDIKNGIISGLSSTLYASGAVFISLRDEDVEIKDLPAVLVIGGGGVSGTFMGNALQNGSGHHDINTIEIQYITKKEIFKDSDNISGARLVRRALSRLVDLFEIMDENIPTYFTTVSGVNLNIASWTEPMYDDERGTYTGSIFLVVTVEHMRP